MNPASNIKITPHIALLSPLPPLRGGISTFSRYLAGHLERYTHVDVYNYKKLYPDLLFPGTSQFERNFTESQSAQLVLPYNPLSWRSSARRIGRSRPNVFIYSSWHPFIIPSTLSLLKSLKRQNPELITAGIFHNVRPHEHFPFRATLTRKLLLRTDLPVVLSPQTQKEAEELLPGKPPLSLFHPVYDRPFPNTGRDAIRKRYGAGPEDYVFLFYGLVRDYKGLDILFHALNEIDPARHKIKVIVAGEFYTREAPLLDIPNESTRRHIHIENRFIPDREADELLYASDVMILPYRSASQSGILADAVNFQLPVICTDLPGFTDVITDQKHGLIIPRESPIALARALSVMADSDKICTMRGNLAGLRKQLSWEKFTRQLWSALVTEIKKA